MSEAFMGGSGGQLSSVVQSVTLQSGIADGAVVATLTGKFKAFVMAYSGGVPTTTGVIIAPQPGESYRVELGNNGTNHYYAKVTFTETSAIISHSSYNTSYYITGGALYGTYTVSVRGLFI